MSRLPPRKIMYRALLQRDAAFEGIFYVCVKTTGIFCRPTCSAKTPRPENVEYFASAQDALTAGYRPCRRCRPLDKEKRLPEIMYRLSEAVEQSSTGKLSSAGLRALGVDPSTARRQFQRYYGITFNDYQRRRRMGLALQEVRNGESIISAQVNNGFESASGFWEAFKRAFGVPASQAEQINCLHARRLETPLGAMLALADQHGLHLLDFADSPYLARGTSLLRQHVEWPVVPANNPHFDLLSEELKKYFEGGLSHFTVPLVITGSSFEREVWAMLQTIPPGETRSYSQIAETVGKPGAGRAVGRANGRNPFVIVVPCHRVIRADNSLCGYGGGVWRKRWLLAHERTFKKEIR